MQIKKVGVLLALILAPLVAYPVSAAGPIGGIGGRPANPDPKNPRTQSIFIYAIDRGAQKTDQMVVYNNTDSKQIIDLYLTDGALTNTGAFTCTQRLDRQKDIGTWGSLSETSVELASKQNQSVDFTITVPKNAEVGEHNGCVVFESATQSAVKEGNVNIKTRQAARISVTIPGTLKKDVAIEQFGAQVESSTKQTLVLRAKNTGNVSSDILANVKMETLFGNTLYTNGGEYPVMPNKFLELSYAHTPTMQFSDKQSPWASMMAIFGGFYTVSGALQYDQKPGSFGLEKGATVITKTTEQQIIFIWPSWLGALIIAGVLLLIIGSIAYPLLRKYSKKKTKEKWNAIVVQQDTDIKTVADYYSISWKKLARINDIKPPYVVKEGKELSVPHRNMTKKPKKST